MGGTKRVGAVSAVGVIGCSLLCVGLMLLLWIDFEGPPIETGLFPRREPPDQVSGPAWHGGTVYAHDASGYPGYCATEIRWRGPDRRDVLLAAIGDVSGPDLRVRDDALLIGWRVWDAGQPRDVERVVSPSELLRLRASAEPR